MGSVRPSPGHTASRPAVYQARGAVGLSKEQRVSARLAGAVRRGGGRPVLRAALLGAILLGCAGDRTTPGTLTVALETTPRTLDPRLATDASSVHTLDLILDALYRIDRSGRPVPALAARGRYTSPTTFRVELRTDVYFQDGAPLRPDDVVASFRSVLAPETGSPLRQELEAIDDVRAEGERAVVFELERPFAPLVYKLAALSILPERLASSPDPVEKPIGTGPYRLVRFVRGERVELEAHPRYRDEPPRTERVSLEVVPNAATRLLELLKGSVHLAVNALPPNLVGSLERREGIRIAYGPGSSTTYLGFNLEHDALSDRRVRRAIAHALDRAAIIRALLAGHARPAAALLPPRHWARPALGPGPVHDPALARKLLDEAGFRETGDGPRLRLSYKTSTDRLRRQIGEVIASQLADVGIEIEPRSLEWGTFYSDVKAGNFHTYTLKWVGLFDPDIFFYLFHSSSIPPAGANRGRFRDAEVDRWIEESRLELDPRRRREFYGRIERALADALPYVFLWHEDDIAAMSARLEGFVLEPGGGLRGVADAWLRGEEP
jgi:peptide/nickel transport system substrate-binding protein